MKYYKGFDKDLRCRGFQYEIGKTYEEAKAELCSTGFHACEVPLDVLSYYPPSDSRYAEVEMDDVKKGADDSKVVSKRITVGAEIGLPGLIKAHVEWVKSQVDWANKKESNTGDQSAATNTGYQSAATANGKGSVAIVTGYKSKVKGAIGCAIMAVERDDKMRIVAAKAAIVDGEGIKADTWYMLTDGEFVAVTEDADY